MKYSLSVTLLLLLLSPAYLIAGDILIIGDSISAAYGLPAGTGWVNLLEQKLQQEGYQCQVTNASISGDTTMGGVTRLPRELDSTSPSIVIIELGGNDGLRGLPPSAMQKNLTAMIQTARDHGAQPLLIGLRIPPNYGQQYTEMFHQTFQIVANETNTPLVPRLLEGIGEHRDLMQDDGLHPGPNAQSALLNNIWPKLEPLLGTKPDC